MQKESISINSWNDMEQFGINMLTAEHCAFSMRLLCDINEAGRELMADYFGLPDDTAFLPAWNTGREINGALPVGHVMIAKGAFTALAEFTLFRAGALAIVYAGHGLTGIFDKDLLGRYEKLVQENENTSIQILRNYRATDGSAIGSRNVHQMSGRAQ